MHTSTLARESIAQCAPTLRQRVLDYLRDCPLGATDDEMQTALSMNPSTQRPRRKELQRQGLIRDSGNVGRTRSGRSATIWVAVN